MAKFRIKIKGFEVEYEGDAADAKKVGEAMQQNLAALIQPAIDPNKISGLAKSKTPSTEDVEHEDVTEKQKLRSSRLPRKRSPKMRSGRIYDIPTNFDEWGAPNQDLTILDKSIYVLFVAAKSGVIDGMSPASIEKTFLDKFPRAGSIRGSNISRDFNLRSNSQGPDAILNLKQSDEGGYWMLTDKGMEKGRELVTQLSITSEEQ